MTAKDRRFIAAIVFFVFIKLAYLIDGVRARQLEQSWREDFEELVPQ
jgi:hypothetical protein